MTELHQQIHSIAFDESRAATEFQDQRSAYIAGHEDAKRQAAQVAVAFKGERFKATAGAVALHDSDGTPFFQHWGEGDFEAFKKQRPEAVVVLLNATGTGNCLPVLSSINRLILKGAGLILLEEKPVLTLAGEITEMMRAAGRLQQLKVVDFQCPENSLTYNPFSSGGVVTALAVAQKYQPSPSEDFWKDVARHSLTAAALCMKLQPGGPAFGIKDIIGVLADFDLLNRLVTNIRATDSEAHSAGRDFLVSYLNYWWDEAKEDWSRKQYAQLHYGTVAKLSAFAHSEYSRIIDASKPDVVLKESLMKGEVVVISFSTVADVDGVSMLKKLFLSDLAMAISELKLQNRKPGDICPVVLLADQSEIPLNASMLRTL